MSKKPNSLSLMRPNGINWVVICVLSTGLLRSPRLANAAGDGAMKLIVPHVRGGEVWGGYGAEVQLYNLAKDPSETNNLASQPGFEPTVDRLAKLLDSWWKPGRERHSVKE